MRCQILHSKQVNISVSRIEFQAQAGVQGDERSEYIWNGDGSINTHQNIYDFFQGLT